MSIKGTKTSRPLYLLPDLLSQGLLADAAVLLEFREDDHNRAVAFHGAARM
ncbi:MAG: hypothetical protein MK165_00450 [Pirellulaceae bacterium]|nr:hypothetical protein [Pirellulaceae bacterium]